jgi:cation transport ATPase
VKKVKGVESAEYNIATAQLKIAGKDAKLNRQSIVQAVERLGHKVEAEDKTKPAILHIEGMDCEDEVSLIEKKMESLKGLESFQVDLMSQALRVQYDPSVSNIRQNIALSLAVIAFLVPTALAGWVGMVPGLLINEVGGLAVIINGLRLLRS